MKIRRWFVLALLAACAVAFTSAHAEATVALDEIGVRYTPSEGEVYVTRDHMDAQALTSLGTDSAVMLDSMNRDGLYLVSLMPDGHQFSLGVSAKPEALACGEYADMTAADKDLFLTLLARKGGYGSATWQENGYALFASTADAQQGAALRYSDLSLSTLYLNSVYTFRMDLIGRDAQQADIDLLLAAADRTLRLGAKAQATEEGGTQTEQPLTLPSTAVESQPVTLSYTSQQCDLTLDPIADTIGVTYFTLSGKTVPGAALRYSVNGKSSSRIHADAQGSFRFTVPNLNGGEANAIELTVFQGDLKTIADFTVTVDWQFSPLALQAAPVTTGNSVTLKGLTLPGSTVKVTQGRGSGRIVVAQDGTFSVTLLLSRLGANDFTLQAQSEGYHRTDFSLSVTRAESADDALARLRQQVRAVDYTRLIAKPAAYAGRVVQLSGQAAALDYADGSPRFVLTTDGGDSYTVLCADLLNILPGQPVELLGTLGGTTSEGSGYPELTLEALLS